MAGPARHHYDRNMGPSPPAATRFGPRQWLAVDAFVAAAMFGLLLAILHVLLVTPLPFGPPKHPRLEVLAPLYLLAPLATLPVAVRRRWPLPVLAVVLVASVAFCVLGHATVPVTPATYALYTVAVQEKRRPSLLALAAVEAGVAVTFALNTQGSGDPVNAGALGAVLQLTVWLTGDAVRRRRAEATRQQQQALAEQRLEIARELHDVIAHAMSVVAVQAGVGSHLIATRPAEAARSLSAIEATARAALAQTRYLLGAVRHGDDDPAGLNPMPDISSIDGLVSQISDAGPPVSLRVEGQPRALSASLELSVYRIVQEALTNVVRHAGRPASAEVVITYADEGMLVTVTDDGCGQRVSQKSDGAGHGLTGMRERVSLLGGELRAGPRPEGGYQVAARLPAEADGR
jgi:signal transduction histidine kinase